MFKQSLGYSRSQFFFVTRRIQQYTISHSRQTLPTVNHKILQKTGRFETPNKSNIFMTSFRKLEWKSATTCTYYNY